MSRTQVLCRHYQLIIENQLSFRQINREPSSSPQELTSRALTASGPLLQHLGLSQYQKEQWDQGHRKPDLPGRYFENLNCIDRGQVLLDDGSLRPPPHTESLLASAIPTYRVIPHGLCCRRRASLRSGAMGATRLLFPQRWPEGVQHFESPGAERQYTRSVGRGAQESVKISPALVCP